ncbi:MmcQ/YjbR family DNA-binding protein [Fusobacterium canifelinum]|uniref:MmcQ/YjbR family DNA-binding protein n=1 Tax=Fusobacterium canifelinum TaxID=285729 RepID=A0A3P1V3P9_9FUSO|nr:MmcQ/YjbR family DNA-binding protein [Fusobacterium canifelinum]RRD28814.1 MmcQ/YjbR family DNA-binding protein [Fusobacterium canifelinum]
MREVKDFIKDKKIDLKRLKKFGFKLKDNSYYYHTSLLKNQFKMSVKISLDNSIFTEIIDTETNEAYVLHLLEIKRSGYSEKVYKAYSEVLEKIKKECFEDEIFKANYAKEIINYIKNKYGDELEFLWKKSPKNAVVRRKSSNKWYAVILTISKRKLNLDSDEIIEVINIHNSPEEIEKLIDYKKYFPAYHMNKKHWCTICLDGTVELKEIYKLIDISYELAK